MITDMATTITGQLPAAANAASLAWDLPSPLTAAPPTHAVADVEITGQAVLVEFTGHGKGELLIVASDEIVGRLMASAAQPADLIAALGPAITAACLALGNVAPDTMQPMDTRLALHRIAALGEAAAVVLADESDTAQAVVAVGAERAAGAPADLYVNGRLIARGEVVVVDENYGLRIMQVLSDETGR